MAAFFEEPIDGNAGNDPWAPNSGTRGVAACGLTVVERSALFAGAMLLMVEGALNSNRFNPAGAGEMREGPVKTGGLARPPLGFAIGAERKVPACGAGDETDGIAPVIEPPERDGAPPLSVGVIGSAAPAARRRHSVRAGRRQCASMSAATSPICGQRRR